jgi:dTDP-glucose 4,6-dehydratase
VRMLVTGGAGFIGSNFARHVLESHPEDEVVVLDKLTYAGRMETIQDLIDGGRCRFVLGDIADPDAVRGALEGCDAIVNFAAESHVDRSIEEPGHFIQTDVYGTYVLLEAARTEGVARYVQISTDEVYGSIEEGSFTEQSTLDPSSPYSASKAGGDLLVSAYRQTYGMDSIVCRASNNYGPFQYPEKLIPLCVLNALHGDPLPVYGDGMQVRNWLYVTDHCAAIDTVVRAGKPGETYNIGGPDELPNIDVVRFTRPLAPSGTSCAETPLVWSVISVTRAASGATSDTRPTRPAPLTTGWSTRRPWSEPLSIVIAEYQTVGERPITRAGT